MDSHPRTTIAATAVAVLMLAPLGGLTACGTQDPPAAPVAASVGGPGEAVRLPEALRAETGETLRLRAALLVRDGRAAVCEALAESDPPQCPRSVPLTDLDPATLPPEADERHGVRAVDQVELVVVRTDGGFAVAQDDADADSSVTAYYVGPGPDGPDTPAEVLYPVTVPGPVAEALVRSPADPDQRTFWPAASVVEVETDPDGGVRVELADGYADRPDGMSAREADLAVQQVVRSVLDGARAGAGVRFTHAGDPLGTVLGVDTADPVRPADFWATTALMTVDAPVEGEVVSGSFTARGHANGPEGNVACWLGRESGREDHGPFITTVPATLAPELRPWHLEVDLEAAGVPAGEWTWWCATDDPAGGTEGRGSDRDEKTIVVH